GHLHAAARRAADVRRSLHAPCRSRSLSRGGWPPPRALRGPRRVGTQGDPQRGQLGEILERPHHCRGCSGHLARQIVPRVGVSAHLRGIHRMSRIEDVIKIETLPDADAVARAGAAFTAAEARAAVAARGRFVMAVSGGHTPWTMLRALADEPLPWADIHVVQVDERVAPAGDPDRNLTHLRESLLAHCPIVPEHVHAMPVESSDLEAGSERYVLTLREIAGSPAVLDLAHLGLGPDGHTASLVPGDPVLDVTTADVALTAIYQGRRRVTLTYPM